MRKDNKKKKEGYPETCYEKLIERDLLVATATYARGKGGFLIARVVGFGWSTTTHVGSHYCISVFGGERW